MDNTTEIQGIVRDYYWQVYANKMENLDEMDKLLETYKPKSKSIHNMNRLITRNETESVIKSLPTKKCPGAVKLHSWILPNI